MSVYVEAIAPYDFHEVATKEKAITKLNELKNMFVQYYRMELICHLEIEDYENSEFNFDNRYKLSLSILPLDIELGNGYLLIDGAWNYSKYFYKGEENVSWLRCMFYDVLRVLCIEKAYIVDEFHGTNNIYADGKEFGSYAMTFEDWKREYDEPAILPQNASWPEIEGIYLDTFDDCKKRLNQLQERFSNLEILTTATICENFLLALESGHPVLVNEKSGKILRFGKIDGINNLFNGAGLQVFKGNKSSFFNNMGKKVTPYRVRAFEWRWGKNPNVYNIEVFDVKTGEIIYKKII